MSIRTTLLDLLKQQTVYLLVFGDGCKFHSPRPKPTHANTPEERRADQALVNLFVVLRADRGRGPQLVQQISDLVGLQTFDHPRIVQFCEDYEVTEENDMRALRDLLIVLREHSLVLDFNVTLYVNPTE